MERVTVDVGLDGPLPTGARPDLSVEGTVEIERLADVLYVERPVHGEANSTVGIFKVVDDGKEAVRVQVQLGRTSVNTVEIVKGLRDRRQGDSFRYVGLGQLRSRAIEVGIAVMQGTFSGARLVPTLGTEIRRSAE